jgi:hypothetical protein
MSFVIALLVAYWQFIAVYIAGGAVYSVVKWIIQIYRLRNKVLAIRIEDKGNSYPGYSDERYITSMRNRAVADVHLDGEYPPRVKDNKSNLFWWAVLWPINLVWTLVADVAKEAWGWLYRKFGALYDWIAKKILPE